jgi:futalosine hydrolase
MKILITAATQLEIQPVINYLQLENFQFGKNEFSILNSGIGGIATTYDLTKTITVAKPDYILQAGVAGSFHSEVTIGSVVCVGEEIIGDMGAEENNDFRDIFDLALLNESHPPFKGKVLINPYCQKGHEFGLPIVRAVSINEITTRTQRMELLRKKYNPDIETMEGAAFHYVCLKENIPFLQVRAISNFVGERDKKNWNLKTAIENLNNKLIEITQKL